jgi:hypothetical protein
VVSAISSAVVGIKKYLINFPYTKRQTIQRRVLLP